MTKREKRLLFLLVAVALGSAPAIADNLVAFRAGPGTQITCGTSSPTHVSTRGVNWCRSDDHGAPWATLPTYGDFKIALVSPSPSPGDDGKFVKLDSTTATGFTFGTASGGSLPTQSGHANQLLTTDGSSASWTATTSSVNLGGTYNIGGTPSIAANITTTDNTYSIGDSTHRLSDVSTGSLTLIDNALANAGAGFEYLNLSTTTAATGGATRQQSPDLFFGGKAWDSAASQSIGWDVWASPVTTGASYSTDLHFSPMRAGTFASDLVTLTYNGTSGSLAVADTSIATAQTVGISMSNSTAAAAGAGSQQYSPGIKLSGQQWNGAASVPVDTLIQVRPVTGSTVPADTVFWSQYNSGGFQEAMTIHWPNATTTNWTSSQASSAFFNSTIDGIGGFSGTETIYLGGNPYHNFTSAEYRPENDLGVALGDSTHRFSTAWSRRSAGVEQAVSAAATITLDPASGEQILVSLSATAITTINAGTGVPGEQMCAEIIQDATGGRSISGWSASFLLAGGAYTVTATANKRDQLCFRWDNTASKWIEKSRSMNM